MVIMICFIGNVVRVNTNALGCFIGLTNQVCQRYLDRSVLFSLMIFWYTVRLEQGMLDILNCYLQRLRELLLYAKLTNVNFG